MRIIAQRCVCLTKVGDRPMNQYLLNITYPALFLAVFARQLCLPVPAILFLLAAGALSQTGERSILAVIAVSIAGCVLGDLAWYEAGRLRGARVLRLLCSLASDPSYCVLRTKRIFARYGLQSLLVAKFIPGLDGVTPPLAGASGSGRTSFLLYDAAGSALWSSAYATLGYLSSKELTRVATYSSRFAGYIIASIGVPFLLYLLWRIASLVRAARKLSLSKITPEHLHQKLQAGANMLVLDLLRYEDDVENLERIPGAIRVNPRDICRAQRVVVPLDLDIIVYCTARSNFSSARVAIALKKHGVRRVRLLEGGLNAWRNCHYPVTLDFGDPKLTLARCGIQIAPPIAP